MQRVALMILYQIGFKFKELVEKKILQDIIPLNENGDLPTDQGNTQSEPEEPTPQENPDNSEIDSNRNYQEIPGI